MISAEHLSRKSPVSHNFDLGNIYIFSIYSNFSFQIGCSKVIYLFDVLTLGAPCFDEGLQDILESGDILKVLVY